jgi:signal transduction histidine kinase
MQDLERMRRSQQYLLGIINDILNYSRIEAGRVTYEAGPVPAKAVVDTVMTILVPQAAAKGIDIRVGRCDPETVAWADRGKVEQILLNLLGNAVKFTADGGHVTVDCHPNDRSVTFVVQDTGMGIPPDRLESIFEPFVQVGRSLTQPMEGAGLGLAISRDLARAMGGELTAASTVGEGSIFTLTLPARMPDDAVAATDG